MKSVLDDAITGFDMKAGPIKKKKSKRGGLMWTHMVDYPCPKQTYANNGMEAWYAIHHMRKFANREGVIDLVAATNYEGLRDEFASIQLQIAEIIIDQVVRKEGIFFYRYTPPKNADIVSRSIAQHVERPFNTLEGVRPFPPLKTMSQKWQCNVRSIDELCVLYKLLVLENLSLQVFENMSFQGYAYACRF